MILAGDVGGTKANLGLFDSEKEAPGRAAPALVRQATFSSQGAGALEELVARFLEGEAPASLPRAACLGVAGPVIDNTCRAANLPWEMDGAAMERRFGFPFLLINDLAATGEGVPALKPAELETLQAGTPPRGQAPRGLLAPGTGLGMALLVPEGEGWRVLPSEGGHQDLAPRSLREIEVMRFLLEEHPGHVSVERVISGPGILAIYRSLSAVGQEGDPELAALIDAEPDQAPQRISEAGQAGTCPRCERTLELFLSFLGAAAGNLALVGLTRGGVYLGGGIPPKLLPALRSPGFLEAFRAKGRLRGLLEQVPLRVILNPLTALWGAARVARRSANLEGASDE